MVMMVVNAVMLVLDVIGRFDGTFHPLAPLLNHTGNLLLYLLSPVLPSCWVLYIYLEQKRSIARPMAALGAIFALHAAGAVLSLQTGWFYTIDSNNIFHRGPYYLLSASLLAALLLAGIVTTTVNRHRIDENHYNALAMYPIPPLVAVALQTVYYGKSLTLNAGVLSLLMLHLNVMSKSLAIDDLTQTANRKTLLLYLKKKIDQCAERRSFSAMMMDLDGFKSINDRFGHQTGDDALRTFSHLVRSCLGPDDLLARYGGDEFCVVMESSDEKEITRVEQVIRSRLSQFNAKEEKPYRLAISIGRAVCSPEAKPNTAAFLDLLDRLMYEDKNRKTSISPNESIRGG
jgi:diguanylate cyclase (GGDEF)-like protein